MLLTVVMGLKKAYRNLNQTSSILSFSLGRDSAVGKKGKKKRKKYRLGSLRSPIFFSFFSNAEPGPRLSFLFHSPRNARCAKMIVCVTEGTRQERHPRSSRLAAQRWRECPPPPNLKKKRLHAV